MAVRLSKIAREFNVGLSTIVEFLHSKGIKISSDPNAKLTDEDYALVAKEFSSDSQVKKESSLVDLKNTRKKKETVTIDNAGNISSGNEDTEEEEEEFISIKDEVRFENKIKIVDHIDLNPEKKTQPEPVEAKVEQPKRETQEEITEKVEEPKVEEPQIPVTPAVTSAKSLKASTVKTGDVANITGIILILILSCTVIVLCGTMNAWRKAKKHHKKH